MHRPFFLANRRSLIQTSRAVQLVGLSLLAFAVSGCAASKWSGDWHGTRVIPKGKKVSKTIGYSETKPSVASSVYLNGDGSYAAKLEEVSYTGDWKEEGQKIILSPKTYMGIERSNFPKTKTESSTQTIDHLYRPYELETSSDGKTLTHTDDFGVVTYQKNG